MEVKEFLKNAASVHASPRQMSWYDTEFYAFVHFTVNTFIDSDLGEGNEDENLFCPTDLDCDEWVSAVKSAGMKGIVLTAKHHDGFCLWPSKYTDHCVKNSKWKDGKGDVVRECAEACKRGGIKFGVYLSPWDRNSKFYGTDEYNDFYCNQLTELLTNYGELFMVWFDGACFEGPNGKKQVYDFDRYNALIRKYQPNACVFNDHGPDVRWCGNEAGSARRSEWAVVPSELCDKAVVQTHVEGIDGDLTFMQNPDNNVGELHNIIYSKGLVFCGAEIDMSIRPSWFYHKNEEPHSLERLFDTYLASCGGNTSFNLNVPPTTEGKFDKRDIARLKELGEKIRTTFAPEKEVPFSFERVDISETQCKFEISLEKWSKIKYITMREDISVGQRIEKFHINSGNMDVYDGFTVGHKKICPVDVQADKLTIFVQSARDTVVMRDITIYEE